MLTEIQTAGRMSISKKQKLTIHRTNFYRPKHIEITCLAFDDNCKLALVKQSSTHEAKLTEDLSFIEIYTVRPSFTPKLVQTITEYESITAVFFLNTKTLLTVSKQQTINFFSLKKGIKTATSITDYGPILCAKFCPKQKLLFTGTGYGYVAIYSIAADDCTVTPVSRLQKVNAPINSLDFSVQTDVEVSSQSKSNQTSTRVLRSTKRKRATSSDSDSDDAEDTHHDDEGLDKLNLTIYGSSLTGIVVWDYRSKTIVETLKVGKKLCQVPVLITMNNGDIVSGDTSGKITIFDRKSLTCRQTAQILNGSITSIATNSSNSLLVVSGRDPTLVVLKRDKKVNEDFVVFEKIDLHQREVTSIKFVSKNDLFTSSLDGVLARLKVRGRTGKALTLDRVKLLHHHNHNIKYDQTEMLIQYDRSLVIWKLPQAGQDTSDSKLQEPVKHLLLKTRKHIHASTFNDKWIAYSTLNNIHIFDRSKAKIRPCKLKSKLPGCHLLELYAKGTKLVACSGCSLYLVDLVDSIVSDGAVDESPIFRVVSEINLKHNIKAVVDMKPSNSLVVNCGPGGSNLLWHFSIDDGATKPLNQLLRLKLSEVHEIVHISYPNSENPIIHVFTCRDQLLKISLNDDKQLTRSKFDSQPKVVGLPENEYIVGLISLDENFCILYSSRKLIKVDTNSNEVVNEVSDYSYILSLNNKVFDSDSKLALVELKSDDYTRMLPPIEKQPLKKFGQ